MLTKLVSLFVFPQHSVSESNNRFDSASRRVASLESKKGDRAVDLIGRKRSLTAASVVGEVLFWRWQLQGQELRVWKSTMTF